MILYIVTFIATVITIIDVYYKIKENSNNKNSKSGIIRNILFSIIIVVAIVFGAFEVFYSTFNIFDVQDKMYSLEYNSSTEKKLLLERYEKNVEVTEIKYDDEILKIDYKMRGLSYENEMDKNKLFKERELL